MTARYDTNGRIYDRTRRADPTIADGLKASLGVGAGARVLDLGCGTGNYTAALSERGLAMVGVDISRTMLTAARTKGLTLAQGDAAALPFADGAFDGVTAVLCLHHIADRTMAIREVFRVLKPGTAFVAFSITREQHLGFWLTHYFPNAMAAACDELPDTAAIDADIDAAGFESPRRVTWQVPEEPVDRFLNSGRYRPHLYLDPDVRSGISTFARLTSAQELERGLAALSADIESGRWAEVAARYANDLGD